MEDNTVALRIFRILALVLVSIIGSCAFSQHDKRDKWEKAVSNGADPMVVSCALYEQTGVEQAACLLLAQNRK